MTFNKNQYLTDLKELISIDCGTTNPNGVTKVINILSRTFQKMDFITEIIEVSKEGKVGPLLVAYNKKDAVSYDALLVGHADTVYEDGLVAKHPYKQDGNRIYGLGSIDMKSGILNGIYAINSLSEEVKNKLSICFIINPDEEIGSIYSEKKILEFAKRSKCALIMESPGVDGCIVNSRKGIARYQVSFIGKSAHASTPLQGDSAINELAEFIIKLKQLYNEKLGTTYNINPIYSGSDSAGNIISSFAKMNFEVRFLSAEDFNIIQDIITSIVNNPVNPNIKINIKKLSYTPPLKNYKTASWLEDLVLTTAKTIKMPAKLIGSAGGSDGNAISELGIPTIDGLGPIGEYWHNADLECLFIDSVDIRIKFVAQILEQLSLREI